LASETEIISSKTEMRSTGSELSATHVKWCVFLNAKRSGRQENPSITYPILCFGCNAESD
jgi:hypothetical protein